MFRTPQKTQPGLRMAIDGGFTKAYWICMLLGCCVLLPYNAFVMAYDYLNWRFPNKNIEGLISIASTFPDLFANVLLIRAAEFLSFKTRIVVGLSIDLIAMAAMPFLYSAPDKTSFFFTIAAASAAALCCGVLESSLCGLASRISPSHNQAVLSGIGFSGLLVCALRMSTRFILLAQPSSTLDPCYITTLVYFSCAALFLAAGIMAYFHLQTLPCYRMQVNSGFMEAQPLLMESHISINDYGSKVTCFFHVLKLSWPCASLVFFTATTTLALVPSVLVLVPSITDQNLYKDWWPCLLLSIFNVCDFIGRCLVKLFISNEDDDDSFLVPNKSKKKEVPMPMLSFLSAIRLGIGALLLMQASWKAIPSDSFSIGLTAALAVTNGFCVTSGMIRGPQFFSKASDKDMAAILMSLSLNFGLLSGSGISMLLVKYA